MDISLAKSLGKGYFGGLFTNPLIKPCRYRVYFGARNTKKSEDMLGREPLFKIMSNPSRNIMFIRKNDSDNRQSTYANLVAIIDKLGLNGFFKTNENPRCEITYRPTGQKIIFRGFNNPTGMTSTKFAVGFLTDIYIEEGSELDSYEDFRQLDGTLRGMTPDGVQLQITIAMNPWNINHWIYEKFVKGRMEDDPEYLETHDFRECYDPEFDLGFGRGLYLHQSTFRVNEFRDPSYDGSMEKLKLSSPELYRVEGLGCWGNSQEATYPEFTDKLIVPHELINPNPDDRSAVGRFSFARYAVGIDTGLSNGAGKLRKDGRIRSATTMQLVGITDDWKTLVCLDEYYFSNDGVLEAKTQPQFVLELVLRLLKWRDYDYRNMGGVMKGTIPVFVDNADIGFRQCLEMEARRQGLYNAQFALSTKLPIEARVMFVRFLMARSEFLVSSECPNLAQEMKSARRGEKGETRENLNDHAINASEYAWTPLANMLRAWAEFEQFGVKTDLG